MSRTFNCADATERAAGLREAVAAVRRGELVVLPTDTVYGLGADAFSAGGIASVLDIKGRGRRMPVPVLVPSPQTLHGLIDRMPAAGWELVDAFWPGGLTLIAFHQPSLQWDLGETRGTVAVRMPLHPVALELLDQVGPMGVTSANLSGRPPARTVSEAQGQLGERVAVYLDAGPGGAMPSTIVDLTAETPRVLRLGALTPEELREVVPDIELPRPEPDRSAAADAALAREEAAAHAPTAGAVAGDGNAKDEETGDADGVAEDAGAPRPDAAAHSPDEGDRGASA